MQFSYCNLPLLSVIFTFFAPEKPTHKMKNTLILVSLLIGHMFAYAQEPLVSPSDSSRTLLERLTKNEKSIRNASMNLQFYTSAAAYLTEGKLDEAAFKLNRVRLEILGTFDERFSYHFRQSFNKYSNPYSLDNLSSSVEYAFVKWDISRKFALTVGKQVMDLGGYEYYVNAIKVREFSDFNNNINCYQAGVTGTLRFSDMQELNLQVLNNRSGSDADTYPFGLPGGVEKTKLPILSTVNWNAYFFQKVLQLRYAASWGQLARKKNLYYLTAGHIVETGPVIAYVDLMYSREGIDSKGILSNLPDWNGRDPMTAENATYFTLIANLDYRIHPNWNIYVKGAYETTGVYRANGIFPQGLYRRTWNAQACLEFFPMKNSELLIFCHLLYKGNQLTRQGKATGALSPDTQRISLGLVYSIPVF